MPGSGKGHQVCIRSAYEQVGLRMPAATSAGLLRRLTLDEKFAICRAVAQECIQDMELRQLLDKKPSIAAYDGFEPSGRMHIAQVCGRSWMPCAPPGQPL